MRKVIHLIPYDGIGGVETAARSMAVIKHEVIDFQVDHIYPLDVAKSHRLKLLNPLPVLVATRRILARNPDLVIVSLWRSCIVGVFGKLLRPRLRLVLFLHYPNHVHWLDSFMTRLTAKFSDQVWADSKETLTHRLAESYTKNGRVISFVTRRLPALQVRPVKPVFIFWGRIHPQKGLDRALAIFLALRKAFPKARFIIIGPDGGELGRIQQLSEQMGLGAAVSFLGGMDFNDIRKHAEQASFYLQTSELEGMAMSVVEAMQLGLVPVVAPVGEIVNYCRHGDNALVVKSDNRVVSEIVAVLNDNARYEELRKNAVATWADKPLYWESVLNACKAGLSLESENSERVI